MKEDNAASIAWLLLIGIILITAGMNIISPRWLEDIVVPYVASACPSVLVVLGLVAITTALAGLIDR